MLIDIPHTKVSAASVPFNNCYHSNGGLVDIDYDGDLDFIALDAEGNYKITLFLVSLIKTIKIN